MERLALLLILVLAPHTKLPIVQWVYPFRPVDILLITAALIYLHRAFRSKRLVVAAPEMLLAFLVATASACWGAYHLNLANLDTLVEAGARVSYFEVAVKKLLLISICFLGFQFVVSTTSISNSQILKYWHCGLTIAVTLHALCYLVTSDYFAVRAGVFVEGNHGGSYYLMSFFLMWFAQLQSLRFGRSGMLLALGGVILSQSTASMVLLLPLMVITYFVLPAHSRKQTASKPIILLIIFAATVFGDEILTKLIGVDIDDNSFSRYDRLASIKSGISMFIDYPLFGMGIQGYAFALPNYVDPFIDGFFDWNSRRIVNNIYIELLAEQGVIGLLVMMLVIYRIGRIIVRRLRQNGVLAAGVASILLSWLAFPTYTISFHWIGMAILVRLAVHGVSVPCPSGQSITISDKEQEHSLATIGKPLRNS